jgi:ribosomal protein S18 acetylase RimI-like enzyme
MITYEWSDWRNGQFWWIQSVYVMPAARRGGVFRALYDHVDTLARSTPGVVGLRLYVELDNEAARRTYERCGMHDGGYRIMEVDHSGAIQDANAGD